MWMSHVPHFVAQRCCSCDTHGWVTSQVWMSHVTRMNEWCHIYAWVTSHISWPIDIAPVKWVMSHMNASRHTFEWVMSHIAVFVAHWYGTHDAAHCCTLQQHPATHTHPCIRLGNKLMKHTATHCNTLQHAATHCNALQHTVAHCNTHICVDASMIRWRNTLQHTATNCNTLQHTATHCNTLQHTAAHCNTHICVDTSMIRWRNTLQHTATNCDTLQHTATHCHTEIITWLVCITHCSTLQHTPIFCNTKHSHALRRKKHIQGSFPQKRFVIPQKGLLYFRHRTSYFHPKSLNFLALQWINARHYDHFKPKTLLFPQKSPIFPQKCPMFPQKVLCLRNRALLLGSSKNAHS